MKIRIAYTHQDTGYKVVTTLPADLLKWERMTGHKMTDLVKARRENGETLTEFSIGYEDLMSMGYAIAVRNAETSDKFDAWVQKLDSIELDGVDETVPPKQGASDTPSESSSHPEQSASD